MSVTFPTNDNFEESTAARQTFITSVDNLRPLATPKAGYKYSFGTLYASSEHDVYFHIRSEEVGPSPSYKFPGRRVSVLIELPLQTTSVVGGETVTTLALFPISVSYTLPRDVEDLLSFGYEQMIECAAAVMQRLGGTLRAMNEGFAPIMFPAVP
jgi:hypothetical protein